MEFCLLGEVLDLPSPAESGVTSAASALLQLPPHHQVDQSHVEAMLGQDDDDDGGEVVGWGYPRGDGEG